MSIQSIVIYSNRCEFWNFFCNWMFTQVNDLFENSFFTLGREFMIENPFYARAMPAYTSVITLHTRATPLYERDTNPCERVVELYESDRTLYESDHI